MHEERGLTRPVSERKGDAVLVDGQVYVCLQDHVFQGELRPGTDAGKAFWQLAVPRIVFREK